MGILDSVDKVAVRAALAEFIASLFFVVFGAGSVCALGESPAPAHASSQNLCALHNLSVIPHLPPPRATGVHTGEWWSPAAMQSDATCAPARRRQPSTLDLPHPRPNQPLRIAD